MRQIRQAGPWHKVNGMLDISKILFVLYDIMKISEKLMKLRGKLYMHDKETHQVQRLCTSPKKLGSAYQVQWLPTALICVFHSVDCPH